MERNSTFVVLFFNIHLSLARFARKLDPIDFQSKKSGKKVRLTDPQAQLKFTFGEFVRFLVNGSREFGQDVLEHKGLSYHWAPFWQECSICSSLTQPDVIIHMETFQADFKTLFAKAGYSDEEIEELLEKFPHTHSQSGGHSHDLIQKYFSSLTKSQVNQLYQLYQLDHELFGYHPQVYLDFAQ